MMRELKPIVISIMLSLGRVWWEGLGVGVGDEVTAGER